EKARERVQLLDRLHAIATADNEDNDRLLERTWNDALLQGCAEAQPLRVRLDGARQRLPLADALRRTIDLADRGQGEEQRVLEAAARLPAGYASALAARVQTARQRVEVHTQLSRALQAVPLLDGSLADAYERAKAAGPVRRPAAEVHRCETA